MSKTYRVLHVDENHPVLSQGLEQLGCENEFDYLSTKEEIQKIIHRYDGLVIRSRFTIDKAFIDAASNLKFIGRVGAGLENIYTDYARAKQIQLISAPEGNRDAVGEHALSLLLNLFNRINLADREIRNGIWRREENRGVELDGKTVGIIGYGNMGKNFAKRLRGFDCEVIYHDIRPHLQDAHAKEVTLEELKKQSDIISLHTPQTDSTVGMVNQEFINGFSKPFYLINTARGSAVKTSDLMDAIDSGKILGAGLDVLEFESKSFENFFSTSMENMPEAFKRLISSDKVILSPHVGGWTVESKIKLAQTIVDKVAYLFFNKTKTDDKQHTGVSGIGGLFLKADDPELLKSWYAEKLGFNVDQWGSTFWWTDKQGKKASTQWSVFPNDTKYFDPSKKDFMFNYRVNNLEKTLEHLKAHGILPLAETEEYNYGKFNWILDPEGNKIELWEPMDSAFL